MHNAVFQFLGYVFCFWMVWKVLDLVFGTFRKPKVTQFTNCEYCTRRDADIGELRKVLDDLEEDINHAQAIKTENAQLKGDLAKAKQHLNDALDQLRRYQYYQKHDEAIAFVNGAARDQLIGLSGIGPVYADKIIAGRPYRSFKEVRSKVPESTYTEMEYELGLKARYRRTVSYR